MPIVILLLVLIVVGGLVSYPYIKKHAELKERSDNIKGLLTDSDPSIRRRAEARKT